MKQEMTELVAEVLIETYWNVKLIFLINAPL